MSTNCSDGNRVYINDCTTETEKAKSGRHGPSILIEPCLDRRLFALQPRHVPQDALLGLGHILCSRVCAVCIEEGGELVEVLLRLHPACHARDNAAERKARVSVVEERVPVLLQVLPGELAARLKGGDELNEDAGILRPHKRGVSGSVQQPLQQGCGVGVGECAQTTDLFRRRRCGLIAVPHEVPGRLVAVANAHVVHKVTEVWVRCWTALHERVEERCGVGDAWLPAKAARRRKERRALQVEQVLRRHWRPCQVLQRGRQDAHPVVSQFVEAWSSREHVGNVAKAISHRCPHHKARIKVLQKQCHVQGDGHVERACLCDGKRIIYKADKVAAAQQRGRVDEHICQLGPVILRVVDAVESGCPRIPFDPGRSLCREARRDVDSLLCR
eukprot:m.199132 g.199132  ORF g.199132 m.199132 type:complete len:387 (+) comp17679_c0_seq10:5436-6596(+)